MTVAAAPIHAEIDGVPAVLPELSVELPGGMIGWFQRDRFDCVKASVCTALQVPYGQVPELNGIKALEEWADGRGLRVVPHFDAPPTQLDRWIAKGPPGEDGYWHAWVMSRARIFFDPASGWRFEGGLRVPPPAAIEYGLSFEAKETEQC